MQHQKHNVSVSSVSGPLSVVGALVLSAASSSRWSQNVRATSSRWRVAYSPKSRAFSIWSLIYAWTLVSAVSQCLGLASDFGLWTNLFWAFSWLCCALWTPLFNVESLLSLRAAMACLLFATGFATAAVAEARIWVAASVPELLQRFAWRAPISILAGWLLTASAINVGIVFKATVESVVVSPSTYTGAPVSRVPLLLSFAVAGIAALVRDPLIPLPLVWAIANLRSFPALVHAAAAAVCLIGSFTAAFVSVFVS